ncbi:MAG: ATP phosphoribosyltransferase regulatory subunit [Candidatus Accumulibacter sp.]|jgi:ATP phosphoribosyltransferase regulatory subunit|nr:ATP phosphoribosyltransferase regulatory subunit [Accumulibacter sp.]
MNWLLPEHIADALPHEAARIERLRRAILDLFRAHGYEFVMPPMLEYLDSLLTGTGRDLNLRTFKLVDQLSGRSLGLRADMTPQVARIDAHLLNRRGVTRLCYCDSVLHTLPASLAASREPIQLGAELFGHAGIEADIEVIRLMERALAAAGASASRIDVSHAGVFRALSGAAGLDEDAEHKILQLLQAKDAPGLKEACANLSEPWRSALLTLPELYGGPELPDAAASRLPDLPEIGAALAALRTLRGALSALPLSFDLADLRGYNYHNGVVFSAYRDGQPGAVAQGGRYDGVGRAFGRARPATGFSMDLRLIARRSPGETPPPAVLAPDAPGDAALAAAVAALRAAGEIVIERLPGETESARLEEGPPCDRRLALENGRWVVQKINGG